MKSALASLLVVFVASTLGFSQDIKVREEGVRLMERANAVSSSPSLPNLERVDTFRVFGDAGIQEGSFSRVVIQGAGRREEYNLGDYHLVNVWTPTQVAAAGTPHIVPQEMFNVLRITPIWLGHFDDEDVIHAIRERNVGGLRARCIEFDTIKGQVTEKNELCVDADAGVLLESKLGPELIDNSDFFSFAGALMPGKISYSFGGVRKIEITQSMTVLGDSDANVLAAPPNAEMHRLCTTFRRPFGVSMPQPTAGNGGSSVDIVVRGLVRTDGGLQDATIQRSERADLDEEARALARRWTFTPSMCDGRPKAEEVDLTLHFQGR